MKYELSIVVREDDGSLQPKFRSSDLIKSDDLVHLLSQFMLVLVKIQKDEHERQIISGWKDDIPF